MTRIIALMALITLGLSREPFHEPFHARGAHVPLIPLLCVTSPRATGPRPPEVRPCRELHIYRGGHLVLATDAQHLAPVEAFLTAGTAEDTGAATRRRAGAPTAGYARAASAHSRSDGPPIMRARPPHYERHAPEL